MNIFLLTCYLGPINTLDLSGDSGYVNDCPGTRAAWLELKAVRSRSENLFSIEIQDRL